MLIEFLYGVCSTAHNGTFQLLYLNPNTNVNVLILRSQAKARVQIAVATLSGNSLRQTVHTHRASVHQAAKLVAAVLRVARVTAGR